MTNRLMPFREMLVVYCKNRRKNINVSVCVCVCVCVCVQNAVALSVTVCDTYSTVTKELATVTDQRVSL